MLWHKVAKTLPDLEVEAIAKGGGRSGADGDDAMEDDNGTTHHRMQHDGATCWIAVALASCVFFHLEEP